MASFSFRNFGLKVLSICIATLLWLVVAGERVVERVLRVPIELQNLPSELETRRAIRPIRSRYACAGRLVR